MPDDIAVAALGPDDPKLAERARAAGVDLTALSPLARRLVLNEFRTPEERAAEAVRVRAEVAEDARLYNEHLEEFGLWNAHIRPW